MNIKRHRRNAVIGLIVAGAAVAAVGAASAAGDDGRAKSRAAVYAFAEPDREVGTSTLKRDDDRVRATMRVTATESREALTLWWVVFNDPAMCNAACDADDIFVDGDPAAGLNEAQIAAADIVAGYATGKVSSSSGRVNFNATLDVNERAGTREVVFGDGATLKDAESAEVHLVARSHGPAVAGMVDEQIGSFAGGCEVFLDPPAQPSAEGECADVLFAVHTP